MIKQKISVFDGAGLIFGGLLGLYCGMSMLIPLGAAFLLWLLLDHRLGEKWPKPLVWALALQAGYLFWFLIGAFIVGDLSGVWLDVLVLSAGILWLSIRPGLGVVIFLSLYHGLTLILNVFHIWVVSWGSLSHKALCVHIIFRTVSVVCMAVGLNMFIKETTKGDAE
jgi:hypothetical protein